MATGYCTVADVRRVLQETVSDFESGAWGEDNNQVVVDAIGSQYDWVRDQTSQHWYVPGGLDEDDNNIIPTDPLTRTGEEQDIPSTPHPQHSTMLVADRGRYPRKMNGPFTRIRLDKEAAQSITALNIRGRGGRYSDWVDDVSKTEGDDYVLYVDAGDNHSPSYIDLRVSSLPPMSHYNNAVRVTYDYGLDSIPQTLRRAVAMRAAAQLLAPDDDAALGIPDNGNLVAQESKVRALERQANELLETYV
jgi:hypothetical protein